MCGEEAHRTGSGPDRRRLFRAIERERD